MWTSLSETIFQYSSSASCGAGSSVSLHNKIGYKYMERRRQVSKLFDKKSLKRLLQFLILKI